LHATPQPSQLELPNLFHCVGNEILHITVQHSHPWHHLLRRGVSTTTRMTSDRRLGIMYTLPYRHESARLQRSKVLCTRSIPGYVCRPSRSSRLEKPSRRLWARPSAEAPTHPHETERRRSSEASPSKLDQILVDMCADQVLYRIDGQDNRAGDVDYDDLFDRVSHSRRIGVGQIWSAWLRLGGADRTKKVDSASKDMHISIPEGDYRRARVAAWPRKTCGQWRKRLFRGVFVRHFNARKRRDPAWKSTVQVISISSSGPRLSLRDSCYFDA
jgi:hypothetical protein